jgi:hypothetical protein
VRNKTGVEPGANRCGAVGAWIAEYGGILRRVVALEEPAPAEL